MPKSLEDQNYPKLYISLCISLMGVFQLVAYMDTEADPFAFSNLEKVAHRLNMPEYHIICWAAILICCLRKPWKVFCSVQFVCDILWLVKEQVRWHRGLGMLLLW